MSRASEKQKALILRLMPEFSRSTLGKLSAEKASDIIDKRLGKKKPSKGTKKHLSRTNKTQAEACKKYGVSSEVKVTTVVRRDRLTTGVRTRAVGAAEAESVGPTE